VLEEFHCIYLTGRQFVTSFRWLNDLLAGEAMSKGRERSTSWMKYENHPVLTKMFCLFLLFFVSACQSAAPTATAIPSIPPTETSTPSPTQTPTLEPTPSPQPTPTDIPAPLGERSYKDRPDDLPGLYQVHLFYILPADATDQNRDLDGKINQTIEVVNEWFVEQSGGSKIRFDTYQGQLDITFVQLDMTNAQFHEASLAAYGGPYWVRDILEENLSNMDVFQPGKLNVAMFEIDKQPIACADAAHPPDLMGRLVGLYPSAVLDSGWDCVDEPFGAGVTFADMGVIHELVHLLGFASSCGKNPTSSDNTSHTGDFNNDLMWAADANSTEYWDTDHMELDPGNDDYFKHGIPDCPDLVNSAFLDPLPANPETPPDWPVEWKLP